MLAAAPLGAQVAIGKLAEHFVLGAVHSVANAGDVDGDGFDDVIAGAPLANQATVHSGRDGSILWILPHPPVVREGNYFTVGWGHAVAGAGDVDGDGLADVIVGWPDMADELGSAVVYSGRDRTVLHMFWGAEFGDRFGDSVAGAGDVDGDGYDDVIVGASNATPELATHAGTALVYSGRDGSILWQFNGMKRHAFFGQAVAGAGDVDLDGFDDVLVGAPEADLFGFDSGYANLYSGKDGTRLHIFFGWDHDEMVGSSLASTGDVNGDGHPDVIVGAPGVSPDGRQGAGSAIVYPGKDGQEIWRFDGENPGDRLGVSVHGAGDIDEDGVPDLVLGAPGADDYADYWSGAEHGSVYVVSGRDGSTAYQWYGSSGQGLGAAVAGGGDVNGDGFPDLMATRSCPLSCGAAVVYVNYPAVLNYGRGLAGSGGIAPQIGTGGTVPELGNSGFQIELTEAVGGSPCAIGLSTVRSDFPLLGLTLYGEFFVTVASVTSGVPGTPGAGAAGFQISIPNDPALLGSTTFWQGFVVDPHSPSPTGLSHTGGLRVMVIPDSETIEGVASL